MKKDTLFQAAKKAAENAYAPYSKFAVGAAVLTRAGNVYCGCNVENAAYPQGWCAETSALANMIGAGEREVAEICVFAERGRLATPCGGCLQKLAEFGDEKMRVHLCDENGIAQTCALGDLFPRAFGLEESEKKDEGA